MMVNVRAQQPTVFPQSDEILKICRRVAGGDNEAKRELMELLFNRIHKTASYLSCNLEDGRDIAQMACVEVLLSAGSYRGESSLAYWADRVTLQTAAKVFTKRSRRQKLRERFLQPTTAAASLDEHAGRKAVRDRLTSLLRALKHKQREVIVFRYIQGYTNQEVADLCGVPLETARDRLKKGRAVLKKKVMNDPLLSEWIREWAES